MATRPTLSFLYPRASLPLARPKYVPGIVAPTALRHASRLTKREQKEKEQAQSKKKKRTHYKNMPLNKLPQYALCDAMRYMSAFEVGQEPRSVKYDLAVRFHTIKNGPTIRNRVQLPHMVSSATRLCVICPPESEPAQVAKGAGAVLIGEEEVFEAVKAGNIDFNKCVCHESSAKKLQEAGIARILGPKGLMPNTKNGTIVKDIAATMKSLVGTTEYRERAAVVRCVVGQLGFSPEQMQSNVKAFMAKIKQDVAEISDKVEKEIYEVVLGSTHSPGFSLNGEFRSPESVPTKDLATL